MSIHDNSGELSDLTFEEFIESCRACGERGEIYPHGDEYLVAEMDGHCVTRKARRESHPKSALSMRCR